MCTDKKAEKHPPSANSFMHRRKRLCMKDGPCTQAESRTSKMVAICVGPRQRRPLPAGVDTAKAESTANGDHVVARLYAP